MAPRRLRQCASCERALEPGELHYRFAVALEGEQDVLDAGDGGPAALEAVLAQVERGPDDPTAWDEQVHWERSGVLCPGCRARLVGFLGGARGEPH